MIRGGSIGARVAPAIDHLSRAQLEALADIAEAVVANLPAARPTS